MYLVLSDLGGVLYQLGPGNQEGHQESRGWDWVHGNHKSCGHDNHKSGVKGVRNKSVLRLHWMYRRLQPPKSDKDKRVVRAVVSGSQLSGPQMSRLGPITKWRRHPQTPPALPCFRLRFRCLSPISLRSAIRFGLHERSGWLLSCIIIVKTVAASGRN